ARAGRRLVAALLPADRGAVPGRGVAPPAPPRLRSRVPRPVDRADPVSPVVLRAARWVDVDAGELRSPAVIVVEGEHIAAVDPATAPPDAEEIDLGDVTLLPGLMDMELNMFLGGPSGGTTLPPPHT